MARLIVIKGPDEGRQFELARRPLAIGRDRANSICLHDTEVSRRHAEIIPLEDGNYQVRDVGSANGTLVNTKAVELVQLAPGDHLQIGQSILVYSASRAEAATPGDLANRIRMVSQQDLQLSSAIVRTVAENAGKQILSNPSQVGTEWLKSRLANLAVMYDTIQAVSHILDLDQLLDRIMELMFQSIEADHGCIMLKNPDTGILEPKAVRYRHEEQRQEKIAISRTIVDYVLKEKQGILVANAGKDARFSSGQSIRNFNLQEVICVPMKGRHDTLGVIFFDTQTNTKQIVQANLNPLGDGDENAPPGKFHEDHLHLAIAIAHQAALAVEDTFYHHALLHAERLAAVGQTIAHVSHHIKNIMQGIVFASEMVRGGIKDKDEALLLKGWKAVEKNQAKIHELVLDMLSYSKDREPEIEMIDLNAVVGDVLDILQGRIEKMGPRLDYRPAANLPPVPADPDGVHKALLNIVSNAVDALEDRPDLYIGVQTLLEAGDDWVRIVVVDHGCGIPADKLPQIFRPFVSSKGSRGTGLGLPLSRKIFREHGGDIVVQSQPGKGSKFILRLPMKAAHQPEFSATQEFMIPNFDSHPELPPE